MTALATSYAQARSRNRANGPAHSWGVLALPRSTRDHVRAVYGFARMIDDLVDGPVAGGGDGRRWAVEDLARRLRCALDVGHSDDAALAAVVDTATRWGVGRDCFQRYFDAMEMDLRGRRYDTEEDLVEYLDGAALAPADMVLPILQPFDLAAARPAAHDLAVALHLADLLADVPEDLDRGRCYLPAREVARYGANSALADRRATAGWVELAGWVVQRARAHLRGSAVGLRLLPARSKRYVACTRAYAGARLDALEEVGFDVFSHRVDVPLRRKLAVVGGLAVGGRR